MRPLIVLSPRKVKQVCFETRDPPIMSYSLYRDTATFEATSGIDLVIPTLFPPTERLCFLLEHAQTVDQRLEHLNVVLATTTFLLGPVQQLLAFFLQSAGVVINLHRNDGLLSELKYEKNPELGEHGVVSEAGVDVFAHPGESLVAAARDGV